MKIDPNYFFLIASVLVASFSQLLLKKGAQGKYETFLQQYLNPWVMMMFGSVFLTILGLRTLDYMNAPVAEAFGYVLVPVLSAVFFHEKITLRKSVGIGCIVVGVIVFYL